MSQQKSTRCYIEEYVGGQGKPGARLREKATGRKVDLGTTTAQDAEHFLRFLQVAQVSRAAMPDVFSKDGNEDCIVIAGDVDFDAPDEIRFIHNDNLSYLFA